jgi:NitT/TauT family transport system substrate-binding protein
MNRSLSLNLSLILILFLTACVPAPAAPPSAAPAEPAKLTLAMGYIPSVQFAPFYVAQERGYFKDAGLDITFRYGFESDLLKLVGTGELPFMIGSGEEVILGRSQGLPVRYVMRWYRKFPVVLFAKAEKGIKSPADLVGKKVGLPGLFGASYVGWEAMVFASGLDQTKVTLQSIGFTQATAVNQDQVDAALDYVVNGPVQLRLAGKEVVVLPVSDYVDLPSNGIITNDKVIKEKPALVQALVTATLRGLADTLKEPDQAFEISLKAVPEAGGANTKVSRAIFDESLKLWQADAAMLGRSDPAAWEKAAAFMKQMGLIQTAVTPADLFTNEFVR